MENKMDKREKVIKGLECCIKRDPDDKPRCTECPYDGACLNRLKIDALKLLKAQEPRVMTLDEVSNSEKAIWLEFKDEEDRYTYYGYAFFGWQWSQEYVITMILRNENPLFTFFVTEYGQRWRCWTSRPTDAQRETTLWMT